MHIQNGGGVSQSMHTSCMVYNTVCTLGVLNKCLYKIILIINLHTLMYNNYINIY